MCICIYVYVYIQNSKSLLLAALYMCVYVSMYTCIHVYMYMYICIYKYISIYVYTYVHNRQSLTIGGALFMIRHRNVVLTRLILFYSITIFIFSIVIITLTTMSSIDSIFNRT